MTQYYSNTKENYVNINDMHHQHVWYAFKKLCDRLEELEMSKKIWSNSFDSTTTEYIRKDVYKMLFDKCERQDNTIKHLLNENSKLKKKFDNAISELFENSKLKRNANSKSVFKLEKEVSRLKEQINRMYKDQKHKGHRYAFSNIPNDDNGQSLVKAMRFYLNKETYSMRVRGQYLDKSKLERGESWKTYDDGQPLSKSKCIRLYIDKKRESA
tara:strand:+ start:2482 stop:3120 length:639 start_codon:yes stop_codon:yes gene_type:complete